MRDNAFKWLTTNFNADYAPENDSEELTPVEKGPHPKLRKAYYIQDTFVPTVRVSPPKEKRCKRATSPGPQWGHDFTIYNVPSRVFFACPQVRGKYGTMLYWSCHRT